MSLIPTTLLHMFPVFRVAVGMEAPGENRLFKEAEEQQDALLELVKSLKTPLLSPGFDT